jgi:hypothetical protein
VSSLHTAAQHRTHPFTCSDAVAAVSLQEAEKIAAECFGDELKEVTPSEHAQAVSCIRKTGKDMVPNNTLAAMLAEMCNKATQVPVHARVHTHMPIGACLPLCS